jgi:hypothetical protein
MYFEEVLSDELGSVFADRILYLALLYRNFSQVTAAREIERLMRKSN